MFAPRLETDPYVAEYRGKGIWRLRDGEEIDCSFDAVQFGNSDVVLFVSTESDSIVGRQDDVEIVEGTTTEGFHMSSEGPLWYYPCDTDGLSPDKLQGLWWTYQAQQLRVVLETGATHSVKFGLTNLMLFGTEKSDRRIGEGSRHLQLELAGTNVIVKPIAGYMGTTRRVRVRRSTNVTCEAICETADEQKAQDLIDGLCHLLSVARGTTIQWVYCDHQDREGRVISRIHRSTDKKPYCPNPLIRPDELAGKSTKEFLEKGFPEYVKRRGPLSGTIDLYLDAKAERDCLTSRGAKMAVAMESLNAAMLKDRGLAGEASIIPKDEFKKVKDMFRNLLEAEGIECAKRKEICENTGGLNRTSFRKLITRLCEQVQLTVEPDEIGLFVKCRNSLIHSGDFYCNTASGKDKPRPPSSPAEEYAFLVHFLDRVFLRLLGYNGPYLERQYDSLVRRDYVSLIPGKETEARSE